MSRIDYLKDMIKGCELLEASACDDGDLDGIRYWRNKLDQYHMSLGEEIESQKHFNIADFTDVFGVVDQDALNDFWVNNSV